MMGHYQTLLSEAQRVKIENGSVVTPINNAEQNESDLKAMGFGKLADNSKMDETIMKSIAPKLS